MSTGVTKVLTVVTALGVVAAFAALAFAHDPHRPAPAPQNPPATTADQLSLEQIEEIEKARLAYREKALPLEQQLDRQWSELESVMPGTGTETDQVLELRRQVRQLERDLEDLRFEAEAQMNQVLSPEQRNRFGHTGDLLAGHDRWSCNQGCPWHERSSWSGWAGHRWRDNSSGGRRGHCW